MRMPKILLVGQDPRLLETRAAVLAKVQAAVICQDTTESLKILERETFDLVVLCHSLSENQADEIAGVIRRRWPRTKILLVVSNLSQERFHKAMELDGTSSPEPSRLIRRAAELLGKVPQFLTKEPATPQRHQAAS
jgi:CheY-like chemotaxis protein